MIKENLEDTKNYLAFCTQGNHAYFEKLDMEGRKLLTSQS